MTVSASGEPVALFEQCDGWIDTVILTQLDADGNFGDTVKRWDFAAADDISQLGIGAELRELDPGSPVALQAWSDTGGGSQYLGYLDFIPDRLSSLSSNRVIYLENHRDAREGTSDEFESAAANSC